MVPLRGIRGPRGEARERSSKAFSALFGLEGLILEGQEDQGTLKQLEGSHQLFYISLVFMAFIVALLWAPWNSLKGSTFREMRLFLENRSEASSFQRYS